MAAECSVMRASRDCPQCPVLLNSQSPFNFLATMYAKECAAAKARSGCASPGRRYAHRLQHVLPLRVVSQAHGIVLPEGIVVA